ncbi:MAG TPA: Maf family protein [Ktedonobacterales bacterium]|nr:Maf family protein [Ktedonobacterales bacterium]
MSESAPLYLASTSPRRRALLAQLGVPFAAMAAPVDEEALTATFTGPTIHLAEHLASAKAAAALDLALESAGGPARVLAGDTTVLLHGQALGKPGDAAQAAAMLAALRARPHDVVTALALASISANEAAAKVRSLAIRTRVTLRDYGDDEVAAYVASGDPFDKAGAYAIQHEAFHPVAAISGCYPNVVGLPICAAAALLGARAPHAAQLRACPWSEQCQPPLPALPR